jgi:hypothetical protein
MTRASVDRRAGTVGRRLKGPRQVDRVRKLLGDDKHWRKEEKRKKERTWSLAKTMGQSGRRVSVRSIDSYTFSRKGYSRRIVFWTSASCLGEMAFSRALVEGVEGETEGLSLLCSFPIFLCVVL